MYHISNGAWSWSSSKSWDERGVRWVHSACMEWSWEKRREMFHWIPLTTNSWCQKWLNAYLNVRHKLCQAYFTGSCKSKHVPTSVIYPSAARLKTNTLFLSHVHMCFYKYSQIKYTCGENFVKIFVLKYSLILKCTGWDNCENFAQINPATHFIFFSFVPSQHAAASTLCL